MTNKTRLAIVIINYKTPQLTINCIESLLPQLTNDMEIVLVDNNSADTSLEKLRDWITKKQVQNVTLIPSPNNSGFSGGNNLGINSIKADYYLLANSDLIFRENAIEALLKTASEYPKIGLFSPRLEWPDCRPQISCFRFHSPFSELIKAAGLSIVTRLFQKWDIAIPVTQEKSFPPWTSFACILIRNEVFTTVGLMDEDYFLYYEDVDYCRRCHNAGWSILNVPDARVVHLRGGSSDVKKNIIQKRRLPRYVYESRALYFRKHYGFFGPLLANLFWTFGGLLALTSKLFGKQQTPVREKQFLDIWINTFKRYEN